MGGQDTRQPTCPANSVGAAQLKNRSISPVKLDPSLINGNIRAWAIIGRNGRVLAGGGKPRARQDAIPGTYGIVWGVKLRHNCATIATMATIDGEYSRADEQLSGLGGITAGYAVAASPNGKQTGVTTFNTSGQLTPLAFDVVIVC